MDDFARFLAFEQRLLERLSTRIESFAYGVAFIDDEFPTKYDANFLRVNDPVPRVAADELVSEAERILATHEHREIVMCDDTDGIRLAPEFVARAWVVDRNMFLTLRREPDRLGAIEIEELPFSEVRPLLEEGNRREPWGSDHETVRALTDYQGKLARVIGARSFAARVRGRLAGSCELYVDGDDAQVESVGTLEEFRGRGIARAVVLRAVEAAREAGAERVFIVADEADWPKDLYVRLGFDRIGRTWQYTRWPEDKPRPGGSGLPG
jgi:ribosomal protein S18 acetylase RimI-like enzyme